MLAVLKTVQYNTNTKRSTGRHWRRQGWGQGAQPPPPMAGQKRFFLQLARRLKL